MNNNRQRQLTPSDYPTEVTYCNSKIDNWGLNINDQITQTDSGKNSVIYSSLTDIEKPNDQQEIIQINNDETTDLLSKSKNKLTVNYIPQASIKSTTSNLVISNENPWKKLSNVRYKIEQKNNSNKNTSSDDYQHVYEQHITFV